MTWIVISVIAAIIIGISIIALFVASDDGKLAAGGVIVVTVLIWFCVTIASSYNTVGQLQVGLVYNVSGTLQKSVGHGVVWLAPWQELRTENIGLQSVEFNLGTANAAVSKDQQAIYGDLQLNYEVEPTDVVNLYKTVGSGWKNVLLEGRMLQDFKQVTSTYTAAQITTERAALRSDTRTAMQKELQPYGIRIVDVLIKNIGYSAAYQQAITEKTIQVQKSLQAQAKVAQAQAEARQVVAQAQGRAKSNLLVAAAQAKALALKGRAIRQNPDVLKLEAIDKLNPNASVIICTGNCPSFLPSAATAPKK